MGKYIFLSLLFVVPSLCFSQGRVGYAYDAAGNRISRSACSYRPGDNVMKTHIKSNRLSLSPSAKSLDMTEMDVEGEPFTSKFLLSDRPSGDIMQIQQGRRCYYRQYGDSLLLSGMENHLMKVCYDMPEVWLRFPMQQGDSIEGLFHGTGTYCDKLSIERFGTYRTKVEDVEKLVLPSGDTLRNVLCLHTLRQVVSHTYPIDTLREKPILFTEDSIRSHMLTADNVVTEDEFRLYAPGYRYPIVEGVSRHNSEGEKTQSIWLFTSPVEQETIPLDEVNKKIRQNSDASCQNGNNEKGKDHIKKTDGFHYSYSVGESAVTVTYGHDTSAPVRVILSDKRGIVYRMMEQTNDAGDNHSITIDYNGLQRGQYVLFIETQGKRYTEKFNVK